MMIASVLHLGRADVKALNIKDKDEGSYRLHLAVYQLFDDVRTEEEKQKSVPSGFLYVDKGGDFFGRKILMLSNRMPNKPKYGKLSDEPKIISEKFLSYKHYRFEVIMNPTKRESGGGKLNPLRTREDIARWFVEKAPQWGFEVKPEHIAVGNVSVKRFEKEGRTVTQAQAQILGQLTVIDKEKFIQSFKQGIGRGRSFGCGLLQIVPI